MRWFPFRESSKSFIVSFQKEHVVCLSLEEVPLSDRAA